MSRFESMINANDQAVAEKFFDNIQLDTKHEITEEQIVEIYNLTNKPNNQIGDFGNILSSVEDSLQNGHAMEDIISKYKENPLHLDFMSSDITDFVLENSHNQTIVNFAIKHEYEFDAEFIIETLGESDKLNFELYIGAHDEPAPMAEDQDYGLQEVQNQDANEMRDVDLSGNA